MPPVSLDFFSLVMEPLAEAIGTDSLIKGIRIIDQDHKIGLFADDVVLTLTTPASSLVRVHQILNSFGSVSYYKLNATKSSILPMFLLISTLKKLKVLFQWATKTFNI